MDTLSGVGLKDSVSAILQQEIPVLVNHSLATLFVRIQNQMDSLQNQQTETIQAANDIVREVQGSFRKFSLDREHLRSRMAQESRESFEKQQIIQNLAAVQQEQMRDFAVDHEHLRSRLNQESRDAADKQRQIQQLAVDQLEQKQQSQSFAGQVHQVFQQADISLNHTRESVRLLQQQEAERRKIAAYQKAPMESSFDSIPVDSRSKTSPGFAPDAPSSSSNPNMAPVILSDTAPSVPTGFGPSCHQNIVSGYCAPQPIDSSVDPSSSGFGPLYQQNIDSGFAVRQSIDSSVNKIPGRGEQPPIGYQFPQQSLGQSPPQPGLSPNACCSHPPSASSAVLKLVPPPEFNPRKYNLWKKEMMFRRDLYAYVNDAQILSSVGLSANSTLKRILMQYTQMTRRDVSSRSFLGLIQVVDQHYQASAHEREMEVMDRFMEYVRDSSGSIQIFWFKLENLLLQMEHTRSTLSESFLFLRVLKALRLTTPQRTSILTLIDCQGLPHSMTTLKSTSIKLFGNYQHLGSSAANKTDQRTFVQETDSLSETWGEEDDDVYFQKKGKRPSRNTPGMEQMAIKKTGPQMNMMNDVMLGKGIRCYRCGKDDHVLKDCPLPYTAVLAFAPRKGKSDAQKSSKKVYFVDQDDGQQPENPSNLCTPAADETTETSPDNECESGNVERVGDSAWISSWFNADEDAYVAECFESIAGEEEKMIYQMNRHPSGASSHSTLSSQSEGLIIDSGASRSVSGLDWILRWTMLSQESLSQYIRPSKRIFRFCNQYRYESIGILTVVGEATVVSTEAQLSPCKFAVSMDIINPPYLFCSLVRLFHLWEQFWISDHRFFVLKTALRFPLYRQQVVTYRSRGSSSIVRR